MPEHLRNSTRTKKYLSSGFMAIWIGVLTLLFGACGQVSPSPTVPAPGLTAQVTADTPTEQITLARSIAAPTQTVGSGFPLTSPQGLTPPPTQTQTQTRNPARNFDHVFIILLENGNYSEAIAQPYLKQLAGQGALLSNYFAVAHPSYPNYLALVAGSTFGINSDSQTTLTQTSLVDLLGKAGISWKFYAEQYPENKCFTGTQSGDYVRKHLPVLSFKNVQSDPALCGKVVPASQLNKDLVAGNLPDYSFYVPDLKNDGHDTGVAYASKWLAGFLPPLLKGFGAGTLVVVTFDEAESGSNNQVYTVLAGPPVKPGSSNNTGYTHYDLLRTIEDNFQLGNLGREDAKAKDISGIWQGK
jgi:hypothetical protein